MSDFGASIVKNSIEMESIDLESIPSQIGTGIIRLQDQVVIKVIYIMKFLTIVSI
jgi:hypothetical protein